ncbi:hypothetical protein ACWDBW_07265 [Streptomyces sp. NPDC001107]
MAKAARWLVIWAVFTIVMRFVTDLADIFDGCAEEHLRVMRDPGTTGFRRVTSG